MYNYCTLFDSNYLTRGLAMYESLKKYSNDFHLFIFAFDNYSFALLKSLDLEFVTITSLKEFEDEELLRIKSSRSKGEYCWTCTPSTIKYSIEKFNLEICTYLDADLYFFSNPTVLIDEMDINDSVLITEHRYSSEYDQSLTSGIYCVQFMTFKNDENGMRVLNWWRNACIGWCYARFENGKFGDQKYLDDWTSRFEGVHVLQNLGGGVAPWNIQQYDLSNESFKVIFYHFHNFKFLENNKVDFGNYKLNKINIDRLYVPYIKHLKKISKYLGEIDKNHKYDGIVKKKIFNLRKIYSVVKRKIRGTYNVYKIDEIIGR